MPAHEKENIYKEQSYPQQGKDFSEPSRFSLSFFITFFVCLITWLVFSGKFDLFHISLGIISSAIVGFVSGDLLLSFPKTAKTSHQLFRLIKYLPWLSYQILLASLHVMYLVYHPKMMDLIDPAIIRFDSRLKSELAHYVFANSITLTPGTITMHVSIYGNYAVHAIDKPSAESLPGEMEERIAKIFGD